MSATYVFSLDTSQQQQLGFDSVKSTPELVVTFISLVILPPIVEEIVFRGFVFPGLRTRFKFVRAALITGLLFAVPHLFASSEGLLWVAGIDTLLLSFVLCYLREKTGALWAPIALHGFKNAVAFVVLFSGLVG